MKKFLLCLVISLAGTVAWAQEGRLDGIAIGPRGPVAGATVALCTQPATVTTTPCSTLATVFTSTTGATTAPNPTHADSFGNYHFYVAPGFYTVQIYGSGINPPTVLTDQAVVATIGSLTNFSVTNNASALLTASVTNPTTTPNLTLGLQTFSGNTVFGNCTSGAATPTACALTGPMLPFPAPSSLGGIQSKTCPSSQWINDISTLGVPTCSQPAASDISGLPTSHITNIQTINKTSNCTTGSSSFDICNDTLTWGTAFADANYNVVCSGIDPAEQGAPPVDAPTLNIVSKTSTQVTVVTQTQRSQTANYTNIMCMGVHP